MNTKTPLKRLTLAEIDEMESNMMKQNKRIRIAQKESFRFILTRMLPTFFVMLVSTIFVSLELYLFYINFYKEPFHKVMNAVLTLLMVIQTLRVSFIIPKSIHLAYLMIVIPLKIRRQKVLLNLLRKISEES